MSTTTTSEKKELFILDKNVDVAMRDGANLKADIFRPLDDGKYPAILNFGPYQKDKLWNTLSGLPDSNTINSINIRYDFSLF